MRKIVAAVAKASQYKTAVRYSTLSAVTLFIPMWYACKIEASLDPI